MAETLATQLTRVQATIAAIENRGQSYTINGRTYTKADIRALYAREQRLLNLIEREEAGSGRTVAEF